MAVGQLAALSPGCWDTCPPALPAISPFSASLACANGNGWQPDSGPSKEQVHGCGPWPRVLAVSATRQPRVMEQENPQQARPFSLESYAHSALTCSRLGVRVACFHRLPHLATQHPLFYLPLPHHAHRLTL